MQSESKQQRKPENVSEPYSLSKLKIKKWIKPTKNTRFKNELQWVMNLGFKSELTISTTSNKKSELMI